MSFDFESVKVMRVQMGDIVVMTMPADVTVDEADRIRLVADLQAFFPSNKAVVLPPGCTLSVMRPEGEADKYVTVDGHRFYRCLEPGCSLKAGHEGPHLHAG